MKQTAKTSKQFPITGKNRHDWMRLFLLSLSESDWLRLILAGYAIYPHLLLSLTDNHSQRPYPLTDGILAYLPVAGGRANINPAGTEKAVRWWVKHRLWDRPFWRSKLRQQGSPIIFWGWLSPTISPVSTLHSRESGIVARQARCFAVPECTHFSARKP